MASLYHHKESCFWWMKFRDPHSGRIKRKSTGFRVGVGPETRRAQQMCAEYTVRESQTKSGATHEQWEFWVSDYLQLRYANAPQSQLRTSVAWRTLRMFLSEKSIFLPRQLTREHCIQYMAWRQKPNKKAGKYRAGHNTAHLELKVIGIIMSEAVLRGYAPFNPGHDLHIKRLPGKIKPALTEEVVQMIREGIKIEPEPRRTFFHNSFEIAYNHGVRISETHLNPLKEVEFITPDRARITFTTKGRKTHTVLLHPALLSLFRELIDAGKTETYPQPASPSKEWSKFLRRIGVTAKLPGACFHSTRVTVASTLARKGIPEKKAMAYLGHASTTVHRSYVRFRAEDLSECSDAII